MTPNVKQLPHNDDAEMSLVSVAMKSREAFSDASEHITHEDQFHHYACQVIWRTIRLMSIAGEPWDLVLITNRLHTEGNLVDAGGAGKVAEIYNYSQVIAHAVAYAKEVKGYWLYRSMVMLGNDLSRNAGEMAGKPEELRTELEKSVFELGQSADSGKPITSKEIAMLVMERQKQIDDKTHVGYMTGFADIDRTFMGFEPKTVTLIAGRPGGGKTKLAINIMVYLAEQDIPCLFYSLEMNNVELGIRAACSIGGVNSFSMQRGALNDEEVQRFMDATNHLSRLPIHWQDKPSLRPAELLSSLRRMKRHHGIKVACVDHILLMQPDERNGRSRNDEVGEISRMVKLAAKECDVALIPLCQMNRGVESRASGEPRLSDLRDSGNLEQDADNVMFLHYPTESKTTEDCVAEIHIAKQRNGPLGKVSLFDRKSCFRFENYAGQ